MRRWFSLLLALVLACAYLPGPAAALAEGDAPEDLAAELVEAVAEEAEAEAILPDDEVAVEVLPDGGEEAVETDLEDDAALIPQESASEEMTFDLGDMTAEDREEPETYAAPAEETAWTVRYSRTAREAAVYAAAIDETPFAWVAADAVVLLPGDTESARVRAAFDTEAGIVDGWVDADALTPLTDDEITAYMDAAAENGPVSLYNDDVDMPLLPMPCRFPEPEQAEDEAPEAEPEDEAPEAEPEDEVPEAEPAEDEAAPEAEEAVELEAEDEPEAEASEDDPEDALDVEPAEAPVEAEAFAEEPAEEAVEESPEVPETAGEGETEQQPEEGMISFDDPAFTLNSESVALAVGASWTIVALDAQNVEIPATELAFNCNSNNISVNAATGDVTAIHSGTALVTVSWQNERQTVSVRVLETPTSVALSPSTLVIGAGLQSAPLQVVFPEGEGALYSFESSDPTVAEVDDVGIVYGVSDGTATISVYVSDTLSAACHVTVEKAPERVTLSANELLVGEGDDSYKLTAEVPQDAHQEPLTWTSSDDSVVSVDSDGNLTANKVSATPVTITVKTYNKKAAKCSVVVANAPAKVNLSGSKLTMYKGQSLASGCSVLDANNGKCTVANMRYATSDKSVVAVSSAGKLTAKGVGTAVVTATAYNGVYAEMAVTVKPAVTSLTLTPKTKPTTGYLGVGQTFSGWKATVSPNGAYAYSLTYTSTNSSILKILDAKTGKFKALKKGTAYIRVTTANGKTAKYKFVVRKAPTKVALSPANGKLKVGQSAKYRFNLYGAGGSYTFTSSNPKVATVSASGKVKALKAGTTKITLKTYNGKKKTVTLKVYAKSYPGMPNYLISTTSSYKSSMSRDQKLEYVIYVAQNKLGAKYVWGSFGPSKFDCSGFTYYCFSKIGVKMQNSAYRQGYLGSYKKIKKIGDLRRGDLVCFNTSNDGDLSDHVGIYLGNGYFIHASSGKGKVIVSNLNSGYYSNKRYKSSSGWTTGKFSWGRRVIG